MVLAVSAAALVLGVPIGLAAYSALSELDSIDLTRDAAAPPGADDRDGGDGDSPRDEFPEVPRVDLDDLSGEDAVFGQLLTDIDRAELTMIDTQVRIAEAFADASPEGSDPEDVTEEISSAAGAGQRELQEIRRDLAAPVDDAVARDLRDTYLSHLDAWVRYFVAVEETPGILVSSDADSAFMLAINTTGDAFAKVIRRDLPNGLDRGVREMADAIVDRGFPERDLADGDTV